MLLHLQNVYADLVKIKSPKCLQKDLNLYSRLSKKSPRTHISRNALKLCDTSSQWYVLNSNENRDCIYSIKGEKQDMIL